MKHVLAFATSLVVTLLWSAAAAAQPAPEHRKAYDIPAWDLGGRVMAGHTLGQQSPGILVGAAGVFRYKYLAVGVLVEKAAVSYDLQTSGLLAGAAFRQSWYRLEVLASGGKHTYRHANDSGYDLGRAGVDGEKYFLGIRGNVALAILRVPYLQFGGGPWVAFEDDLSRTTDQFTATGGEQMYDGTVGDRRLSLGLSIGGTFSL